jgi:Icc-related predicted phosphoesterase
MATGMVRLAAICDLHVNKTSEGAVQHVLASIADAADVLLLAGDLTDYGLPEEARVLAKALNALRMPVAAVLGNHDLESGKEAEVRDILSEAGVKMLDGDAVELKGVGIAGVKGFCGGFGPRTLGAWGEAVVKAFVHEALNEALKLESALARIRAANIVALLHYSPIQTTVEGEPPEIYPFLGTSRLEEPISRFPVSLVCHGHAHRGRLQGVTKTNVPVYNVSMPLLARAFTDRPPFRIFEVPAHERVLETTTATVS